MKNRKHYVDITPTIRYNRSRQDLSHSVKTTMNVGTLYPIDIIEVLPGDTFNIKGDFVSQVSSSFVKPILDNLFFEKRYFFVPFRLLDEKAQDVFGVASPSSYIENERATIPCVGTGSATVVPGSIADYLGLPVGSRFSADAGISVYPFRAFALIYNHWYRNENVIDETYVPLTNENPTQTINGQEWSPTNYLGMPPKVSKFKDTFVGALPQPQKGASVSIPMAGTAPIVGDSNFHNLPTAIKFGTTSNITAHSYKTLGLYNSATYNSPVGELAYGDDAGYSNEGLITKTNMVADMTAVTSANINDWRYAFALQRMLEKDARFGSRYNEYVFGHFGVEYPDIQLFPEYLGGSSTPMNIQMVAQTSAGTEDSPQANLAGYSLTNGSSRAIKSFKEHGYIICCANIRQIHTYSQGFAPLWRRTVREDFYDPTFANIGEQPILQSDIFNGSIVQSKENTPVFGYTEAWYDYRHLQNRVSGQLRPGIGAKNLGMWTLVDVFENAPTLSKEFIEENTANIDRVLSVESAEMDNFLVDFRFTISAVRVMPVYSVPGLIDHH